MQSAIYQIRNLTNDKVYVGSAVDFERRKKRHLQQLKNGIHHSLPLQRAFNKYGFENFVFEIIKECEKEVLFKEEQQYLDIMKPFDSNGYNVSRSACGCRLSGVNHAFYGKFGKDNPNFGKKRTQEQKDAISLCLTGKKLSEETKKKMSVTAKKNAKHGAEHHLYGTKMLEQHKNKISKTLSQKVVQYDKTTGEQIKIWDGCRLAGKMLCIDHTGISKCCNNKTSTAGGFIWRKFLIS